MQKDRIIVAGAGGQGALRIGQMLAYAALDDGWEVEWLPSYGAEMRGGTANCNVTISDSEIAYPMVTETDCLIVMNDQSLKKFEPNVCANGILILDRSIIRDNVDRTDLKVFEIPADHIAEQEGNSKGANMVLLGAYLAVSGRISIEAVSDVITHSFTGSKSKYADSNKKLVRKGFDYIKEKYAESVNSAEN